MSVSPEQLVATYTFWLAVATFALGFATAVLAAFTMMVVMNERDTARRQLRAYICDITGIATLDGGAIKTVICLNNSGLTPAYDVEIFCEQPIITRHNLRPFDQAPRFAPIKTIIGSGTEFHLTRFTTQIAADDLDWLQNGTCALFVWGRVNYTDAFRKRRHFVFRCLAIGPANEGWKLIPHPDGYEAD